MISNEKNAAVTTEKSADESVAKNGKNVLEENDNEIMMNIPVR